eukprot:IDg7654t1
MKNSQVASRCPQASLPGGEELLVYWKGLQTRRKSVDFNTALEQSVFSPDIFS